jgi:glycosyltransferase involved in cell wall biosynthesis
VGKEPLLSIIVTSYSTERLNDIVELLDGIEAQTYQKFETILVIEKSTELYKSLRTHVEDKGYPNIRILVNSGAVGISASRNMGIREAKGDIIAFIDDDAVPFPNWAEEMVKIYDDDSIIGVTGSATPLWEDGKAMSWFPKEFYWMLACSGWRGLTEVEDVRNVLGANMSFRREAFEQAGFFPEWLGAKRGTEGQKTTAEETELSIRITNLTGKRIIFSPNVRVRHKVPRRRLRWGYLCHRAYIEGYSKGRIARLYRTNGEDSNILATEHALLRRILFSLLPNILKSLFTNPSLSFRKLLVTVIVLLFVGVGYLRGTFYPRREHIG